MSSYRPQAHMYISLCAIKHIKYRVISLNSQIEMDGWVDACMEYNDEMMGEKRHGMVIILHTQPHHMHVRRNSPSK